MTTLTKNIFYFSKDKENNFILNRKEQINIEFLDLQFGNVRYKFYQHVL